MRLSDQEKKQLVVYDTRKEQPSIWNLQAFVIVFLFIMLGTTINVYSVNNDNLTWVDSNGDFKLDSYDHSMINLDTDLVELNGLSLNEVFYNNEVDLSLFVPHTNTSLSITNNELVISPTTIYAYPRAKLLNLTATDDKVYFNWTVKSDNDIDSLKLYAYQSSYSGNQIELIENNPSSNIYYNNSGIVDFVNNDYINVFMGGIWSNGTHIVITSKLYMIYITDLGIDNLTKSQMDEYYNLYVSLQENRIEAYKDLGNEPISQWQNLTQTVSSLIDDILQPVNDVNDWINKFMNGLFS